ncbi:hypothetical protein BDZ97DRAFT_1756411 [Flammula alnicola]|nr:hypothetical protein BDZ97DRAFT_1756411 [Flammula alnicola]
MGAHQQKARRRLEAEAGPLPAVTTSTSRHSRGWAEGVAVAEWALGRDGGALFYMMKTLMGGAEAVVAIAVDWVDTVGWLADGAEVTVAAIVADCSGRRWVAEWVLSKDSGTLFYVMRRPINKVMGLAAEATAVDWINGFLYAAPKPDLISLGAESLWGEFTLVDLKIKEGIIIYDCCSDSPYHLERLQFCDDLEGSTYAIKGIVSLHSFLCDEVKETMASMLLSRTYWGPWKTSTIVLTKSLSSPAFHCFWKEHASSPLIASLGGIGSLVSDLFLDSAGWDFSPSAMYVDPVTKIFLIQLRNYAQEFWEAFLITVHVAAMKVVIIPPMHKKVIPAARIWNSAEAYSESTWSIIQLTYPFTGDKDTALIQFYLSPSTCHTAITVVNALDVEVIVFSMWHAKQGKFDISRDGICLTVMLIEKELYGIYYSRDTNSKKWSDMKQLSSFSQCLWTPHHHTTMPVMIFLQGSNTNSALTTSWLKRPFRAFVESRLLGIGQRDHDDPWTIVMQRRDPTNPCPFSEYLHALRELALNNKGSPTRRKTPARGPETLTAVVDVVPHWQLEQHEVIHESQAPTSSKLSGSEELESARCEMMIRMKIQLQLRDSHRQMVQISDEPATERVCMVYSQTLLSNLYPLRPLLQLFIGLYHPRSKPNQNIGSSTSNARSDAQRRRREREHEAPHHNQELELDRDHNMNTRLSTPFCVEQVEDVFLTPPSTQRMNWPSSNRLQVAYHAQNEGIAFNPQAVSLERQCQNADAANAEQHSDEHLIEQHVAIHNPNENSMHSLHCSLLFAF